MTPIKNQSSHTKALPSILSVFVVLLIGLTLFSRDTVSATTTGLTQTKLYLPIIFNEYPPIPKLSSNKAAIVSANGECATISWEFVGADSVSIIPAKGFMKKAVSPVGSMEVCPSILTFYEATAVYPDKTVTLVAIVNVIGSDCNRDPYVHQFNPTTTQVDKDEGITVTWDVRCNTETYLQLNDSPEHHVQDFDQKSYFMHTSHYFQLRVTKVIDGMTIFEERAAFGVTVRP